MTDKITITFNGEEREIFASFGLLNSLTKIVASPELVPLISLDPDVRTSVLIALLSDRTKTGKITKAIEDIEDIDVSIEDVEKLLEWASRIVLGFFMRSLRRAADLSQENKEAFEALKSSATGLAA